jgi:glucose-1-phosphatase
MSNPEKPIKAVIFDMGGVLLRTHDLEPRTKLASRFGLSRLELEALVFQSPSSIEAEKGLISEEDHWLYVADKLGLNPAELPDFIDKYWIGDRLDENLVDYLRDLRPAVKTGLLSNAWNGARASVSKKFSFLDAFDQIVFSAEVGMRKPDKAIFDLILDRLKVPADQAVFVDDFIANIDGAQNAGLKCIHFVTVDQALDDLKKIL